MKNDNKKHSIKIMAGVLTASIIIGNGYWLASAQEVNQIETEADGETLPAVAAVSEEAVPAVTAPAGTEIEGVGSESTEDIKTGDESSSSDSTEASTSENSGADQQENTDAGEQENPDQNQQENTAEESNVDKTANAGAKKDQGGKQQNHNTGKSQTDKSLEKKFPAVESDSEWNGDSVPGWVDSAQEYINGNLEAAEQIRLLEAELNDRVNRALTAYNSSADAVTYEDSNFLDIFAVYAVKHNMTDNFPYGVEFSDQEAREELVRIFHRMTRVNKVNSDNLTVRRLTYADVIGEYGFDETQEAILTEMVNDDARVLLQEIYDTSILSTLSDDEFAGIEAVISGDASGARRSVLIAALSLEGKVNYFWGGKSYHIGWDQRWGRQGLVTAEGSSSTGMVRSYGLDCSGFVSWAFINGGGDQNVLGYIGNGTANQWANSYSISWEEIQPGDLVFYKVPNTGGINHIGIVISNGSDGVKVVHCSGGKNGVVVTGKVGFQYARRPYIYPE